MKNKFAFTLTEDKSVCSNDLVPAFTLAEVLITLAIIGIVAALTIPNLVQSYKKRVVETRLARFHSMMNQAIKLSEVDNGPKEYWITMKDGFNDIYDAPDALDPKDWYDKYLKGYIKVLKVETNGENAHDKKVDLYFPDGSMATISGSSWVLYPNANDYKLTTFTNEAGEEESDRNREDSGTKNFTFNFYPDTGIMPYCRTRTAYYTDEDIKNNTSVGCTKEMPSNERALCALWIMKNGWKIPDDYPLKF